MSLVNDALKRARAAQDQAPTPSAPAPQFRPVDSNARSGAGKFVPVVLVVLVGAVVALGWQVIKKQGLLSGNTPVQARSKPASVTVAAAPPLAPPPASAPSTPAVVQSPSAPAAPVVATATPVTTTPATATPPAETPVDEETLLQRPPGAVTQPAQTAAVEPTTPATPPAPEPLRLQSIFAHPTRPSAMVSGKVLFVGDRVRDYRLKSIKGTSVSLDGPEGTIVLTLR